MSDAYSHRDSSLDDLEARPAVPVKALGDPSWRETGELVCKQCAG